MNCDQIESLREAHDGCDEHCAVKPLVAEIDRQAELIADMWLLLDDVARMTVIPNTSRRAAELLRKQKAPGWK